MIQEEQQAALYTELITSLHRLKHEFDITNASVIGVLEMIKLELYVEACQEDE